MKVIHKKSIIVLIFLLISAAISAEVIELIDGTRVWRQFASDEVLEYAKDPALRPSNQGSTKSLSLSTLSFTASSTDPDQSMTSQTPDGSFVPQEEDGIFRTYGAIKVSPQSGSYRVDETDLMLPGIGGYDLRLSRWYSPEEAEKDQSDEADDWEGYNIGDSSFSFGKGWRLSLPHIRVNTNFADALGDSETVFRPGLIFVYLENGAAYQLSALADLTEDDADNDELHVYENYHSRFFRILCNPTSPRPFSLVLKDGTYYDFDKYGRVREIYGWADGHRADTITIHYASTSRISYIENNSELQATFSYNGNYISTIVVSSGVTTALSSAYTQTDGLLTGVEISGGDTGEEVSRTWVYGYDETTLSENKNTYDEDEGSWDYQETSTTFQYLISATDPNGSVSSIEGIRTDQKFYSDQEAWKEKILVTAVQQQEQMLDDNRIRTTSDTKYIEYDYVYEDLPEMTVNGYNKTYIPEVIESITDCIDQRELQKTYYFNTTLGFDDVINNPLHRILVQYPDSTEIKETEYDWDFSHRVRSLETRYDISYEKVSEYWNDRYGNVVAEYTEQESGGGGANQKTLYQTWTRYRGSTYPLEESTVDVNNGGYPSTATWKDHPYYGTSLPTEETDLHLPVNLPVQKIVANSVQKYNGSDISLDYSQKANREYRQYAYGYGSGTDDNAFLITNSVYHNQSWSTVEREYMSDDSFNRIATFTNPSGFSTSFTYRDPSDGIYVVETTKSDEANENILDGESESYEITSRTGYDVFSLRPVWEMSGRGYVTEYERDAFGRITGVVLPDVNEADDTAFAEPGDSDFSVNRENNPTVVVEINDDDLWREITDPLGRRTRTYYSSFGKKEQIIRYVDSGDDVVTDIEYNGFGLPLSQTDPANGTDGSMSIRPQTTYEYDSLGHPVLKTYADGTSTFIEHDYNFGKTRYTNERGYTQEEYHSIDGKLLQTVEYLDLAETDSRSQKYYYDGLGNLRFETDFLGNVTQYSYDERLLLDQITYPNDEEIPFWEEGSLLTEAPYPYVQYEYNADGYKVQEITQLPGDDSQYTLFKVDGLGRPYSKKVLYTDFDLNAGTTESSAAEYLFSYDGDNNILSTVDARHSGDNDPVELSYTYSPQSQVITQTDPEGNSTVFSYHDDGKLASKTDPRGQTENYPDFLGDFVTSYTYDELGRLETQSLPLAADGTTRPEITYSYYPNGSLESRTTAEGAVQNYEYTERGWIDSLEVEGGAHTYTTTYLYDDVGNEIRRIMPGGAVSSTEYDGLNRAVKVISPENTVRRFEYDVKDRVTAEYDGNGIATEYTYNVYGQIHEVTQAANSSRQGPEKTTYWYDRLGNRTRVLDPVGRELQYTYDERGLQLTQYEVGLDKLYSFSYDEVGNMNQSLDPRGTFSTYEYDDNNRPITVTMANGTETKTIIHTYDEAGFMYLADDDGIETAYNMSGGTYVPDPYGRIVTETTTIGSESFEVGYDYNLDGKVTGVTSPSGRTTQYTYNSLGELLTVPGVIDTAVSYNAMGLHQNAVLTNGVNRSWEYDLNGRLTKKSDNGTAFNKEWRFTYDDADNILWKNDDYYEYDDVDRLTREVRSENLVSITGALPGYVQNDVVGSKPLEFDDDTTNVNLDFNAGSVGANLGGVSTIERVTLTPTDTSHRVNDENIQVYTSTDNATYTEETEWQLRVCEDGSLELAFDDTPEAQYIKVHCTYDERDADLEPVEDVSEFANELAEIISVFASTDVQSENSFTYDKSGNRTQETAVEDGTEETHDSSYYADGESQRLKTNGSSGNNGRYAFVYDENGNMTARGTYYTIDGAGTVTIDTGNGDSWSYQWDLADRLTGASHTGAGSTSYSYSPRGLRVSKTGTDGTTVFIYDQWGNVLYERSGSEYRDYIRAFGSSLVRIDGTIDSDVHTETSQYYYHTDHLGTVEAVTDASGTEVWSANYSAFGELLGTTGSLDQEAVYTGKDYDDEVGLYYFNARWYDPELGRFISEDPAQDGVNWYVYVSNNPLKFVDPTGLDPSYTGSFMDTNEKEEDEGDGDNDNEGSGNNTNGQNQPSGQTPTPEPEKKSAWEAFKDFLGFGEDEEGNPNKNPIERLDDWVLRSKIGRIAKSLGIDPDEIADDLMDDIIDSIKNNDTATWIAISADANWAASVLAGAGVIEGTGVSSVVFVNTKTLEFYNQNYNTYIKNGVGLNIGASVTGAFSFGWKTFPNTFEIDDVSRDYLGSFYVNTLNLGLITGGSYYSSPDAYGEDWLGGFLGVSTATEFGYTFTDVNYDFNGFEMGENFQGLKSRRVMP